VEQYHKVYVLPNPITYHTSGKPVVCTEGVRDLELVVDTVCGSEIKVLVSGTIAPDTVDIVPFLVSGVAVSKLLISKGKLRVWFGDYEVAARPYKGMTSVEFRYYVGGPIKEVAMAAMDISEVNPNVIRQHRIIGHQGAYKLRTTLLKARYSGTNS